MLQTLSCLWYLMMREDPFSEEKLGGERRENLSKVTEEGLVVGGKGRLGLTRIHY